MQLRDEMVVRMNQELHSLDAKHIDTVIKLTQELETKRHHREEDNGEGSPPPSPKKQKIVFGGGSSPITP